MQIETSVLNALGNAQITGSVLKLVEQMDRNLYVKTNKVLEAAGGKWNRKAGGHIFDGDAAEAMDQIILTGQISAIRTKAQQFGFFPTPLDLATKVIQLAKIQPGMTVLEPSAGKGSLAYLAAAAGAHVDCVELMDTNFAALAGDMKLRSVRNADFLTLDVTEKYDRVVMNPPFDKQADIRHVQHAMKFLKDGGRLVSVMAAGVTFRTNRLTTDFRDLVNERGGVIEPVPEGTFKESGTSVNTVLVTIPN